MEILTVKEVKKLAQAPIPRVGSNWVSDSCLHDPKALTQVCPTAKPVHFKACLIL